MTTFGPNSTAFAVNADGSVVVGTSAKLKSFRWSLATGMVALPLLPNAAECTPADVSADGVYTVGQCTVSGKRVPVRWRGVDTPINLGVPAQHDNANAVAVNANGTVIVGSSSLGNDGGTAVIWTIGSTPTLLMNPNGVTTSSPRAVNGDGSVVVGEVWNGKTRGFRWTSSGGMQLIPDTANGFGRSAVDVNADGSKVVIFDASDSRAYVWSDGVFSKVGTSTGVAIAISGDGATVLTSDVATTTAGTTQTLASRLAAAGYDLGDFIILGAEDISADGKVILGSGYHNVPNPTYDGFMVTFR